MGKLKTKKTLSKRVKITKNGKVMHKQTGIGHLKIKHDSSRKARKNRFNEADKAHSKSIKRLLGI